MRVLIFGVILGASLLAQPVLAEDFSFGCTPAIVDNAAKDPIVRIQVEHHGQNWSVVHFARSGTSYDRSTQYYMNNVIGAPSARWRGPKLTSPNLLMVGMVDNVAGQSKYTELLVDRNRNGAIIMQSEANCFPRADASTTASEATPDSSASAPTPPPPVTTPVPQQIAPLPVATDAARCSAISEPTQRLSCYDKAFPPPSSAANTSVQPTANANEVARFSGDGKSNTRPFRVSSPWVLNWTSDGYIHIRVNSPTGEMISVASSNDAGSGNSYIPQTGEFYLEVSASGNHWDVWVTAAHTQPESPGPISSDFSVQDIEQMHDVYSQNPASFDHNYIGKSLSAELEFNSAQDALNRRKFTVFFSHDVACDEVSDSNQIETIASLKKGDLVILRGTITDHTFGNIHLKGCSFAKP